MRRVEPKLYTKEYYLTGCTGYNEFKKTWGKVLEPRLKRIVKEIPSVKGLRVLDIGCGRGELVFWSARQGAKEVLGIDYSKNAIELANIAKNHYTKDVQNRVNFIVMDAKKMNFPNYRFDAIYMTEVLEHLYPEEQESIFKKIYNILDNNGFVVIHTAPNKWFINYTYRFWCYPISTFLIWINYIVTKNKYSNLLKWSSVRKGYEKLMHINEPIYFSLKILLNKHRFTNKIYSTNITVTKPELSWKDYLFNFLVYLYPLSKIFPFNVLWGNDFIIIARKLKTN